jgi:cold shock CspA family protein
MPTGRVKVFNPERKFGFITAEDGNELYVTADAVPGGVLHSGDEVEFEAQESEKGRAQAASVTVTKKAPADNPVGRTMANPPSWDQLEERERQRRQNRRRRR